MDAEQRKEVQDLLEKITHSGSSSLDQVQLKKVKNFCRQSDSNVREVYRLVMKYLAKKHAQVRLSAFQVLNELFNRSNQFRELVLADFKTLSSLVTGTDNSRPLPLPKEAAAQLKKESLLAIREWNQKFGSGYPELRLGYNYLKFNRKVDFDELVAHSQAERRRRELRDERRRTILQQRIQEVKLEMEELKKEVGSCLMEMEACFNLLLPRFDLPDIYQSKQQEVEEEEDGSGDGKRLPSVVAATDRDNNLPAAKRRRTTASSSCSFVSLESDSRSESEDETERRAVEVERKDEDTEVDQGDQNANVGRRDENAEVKKREGNEEVKKKAENPEGWRKEEKAVEAEDGATDKTNIELSGDSKKETLKEKRGDSRSGEPSDQSEGVFGKGFQNNEPLATPASEDVKLPVSPNRSEDSDSDVEWEDVPPDGDIGPLDIKGPGDDLQEHGLPTRGLTVPVMIGPRVEIEETEDNTSILSSLRENRQLLLTHFMPSISRCLEWMNKAGEESCVLAAIDLKSSIHAVLSKYDRLNISAHHTEAKPSTPAGQSESAARATVPVVTDTEWKFGPSFQEWEGSDPSMELDPTTADAQLAKLKLKRKQQRQGDLPVARATSSRTRDATLSSGPGDQSEVGNGSGSEALKSQAPVVPFDMDLYHWREPSSKVEPRTLAPIGSLHRFWAEEKEVTISQDEQNRLKCRTISFPGRFQPVTKSCRALLPSGKLCPRKDRFKCPFHGPIIPRDQHGNPVLQSEDSNKSTGDAEHQGGSGCGDSTYSLENPLWQDKELQEDIMAATGLDLRTNKEEEKKKGKGKKKSAAKYPGLTDLSTLTTNPRQRLEKKLLGKRALKKVAQEVDKLAAKKFDDKFGNNFNYALNS